MSVNQEGRMLFTPPINNTKFDINQSIRESYQSNVGSLLEDLPDSGSTASGSNVELTREEIEQEIGSIHELPLELSKQIDAFIYDLKQPKYMKPLTINQLASLFQSFYSKFDKASFNFLMLGNSNVNGNQTTYLSARDHLSSGLSGIFARSRSSSGSSIKRNRRSSSLFSSDSNTVTPMLSPEEISKQLRLNELTNLKIERYMEFCETEVFNRLLAVGTSVPPPTREERSKGPNQRNGFKITDLFKNSPEYGEYDKLLYEKIKTLSRLSSQGKIDLSKFLGIPETVKIESLDEIEAVLQDFINHTVSPTEKVALLLKIHEYMMYSHEMSNDEFLSLLIYYVIKVCPQKIFLNTEFIRLFRYKKKLIQKELYALTNLEAALVFLEGLTMNDFSSELQDQLSLHEQTLLASSISNKINLPNGTVTDNSTSQPEAPHPEVIRSNSYDGIKNVFDSSLKNIFDKIRSYTPPAPQQISRSTSQLFSDGDKKPSTKTHTGATGSTITSGCTNTVSETVVPDSWKVYQPKKFDDLTISELREIFEIYQKLIK